MIKKSFLLTSSLRSECLLQNICLVVLAWLYLTKRLCYPAHERVEKRSIFLLYRVHNLLSSQIIVFFEMLVQMGLQLLISDEPLATVGALELDSFVELSDRQYVEPKKLR